jgi:hypothetical protein
MEKNRQIGNGKDRGNCNFKVLIVPKSKREGGHDRRTQDRHAVRGATLKTIPRKIHQFEETTYLKYPTKK